LQRVLLDDPSERIPRAADEPFGEAGGTDDSEAQYVLRLTIGRGYDAATLTRRDVLAPCPAPTEWRN
jgi:hypothetical protein